MKASCDSYGRKFCSCLALCALVFACGRGGLTQTPAFEAPKEAKEDAYQQMALYIQEGFRTYDIAGTYHAYFDSIDDADFADGTGCVIDILLEGNNGFWMERLRCSYDAENDWYTFKGIFEPIFTKNTWYYEYNGHYDADSDADYVKKMLENPAYITTISKTQDSNLPVRYDAENGPLSYDSYKITPVSEWPGGYLEPHLYTYYDDRMDLYITIDYPQIHDAENEGLEARINAALRETFFSAYNAELHKITEINPTKEAYGSITKNYVVTRADESYLSMRIYNYMDFRGNGHPGEWEDGLTINRKAGEILHLQDVVGKDKTPITLLDTDAFHIIWTMTPQDQTAAEQNWFQLLRKNWEWYESGAELSSLDAKFYLTTDSLGLITDLSYEYLRMEASFADLGITLP